MEKFYYLPQDTSDILYKFPRERIENFALLLNKLVQNKESLPLDIIFILIGVDASLSS